MTAPVLSPAPLRWDPAAAIRGTVVILHGRGEHGGLYERLGRRLAADGYAVAAPDLPDGEDAALAGASTAGPAGAPFVIIGSDTGAVRAVELASVLDPPPDALVLAGLPLAAPGARPPRPASWDEELDARTACPVHRGRLTDDSRVIRGGLSEPVGPVPAELPDLPTFVVQGDGDQVADIDAVRAVTETSPRACLAVVHGGRHDILNDDTHRAVASYVVLFLESVRAARRLATVEGI